MNSIKIRILCTNVSWKPQHQYQVKNEAISEEINFMGRQAQEDKAQV